MIKRNYFVKFLKKINLLINNLLKEYLNKLNFKKFSNIAQSNKFFLTFVALIILFLSYLLIPNIYDNAKIKKELTAQLKDKFNLNFNLPYNYKYNFFPRPHFTYENSTILKDQNEISKINKLKIYVSLDNLFSLESVKVKDLILDNAIFKLNNQNYDFFIKLLDENFKDSRFIIRESNIFYRNINKEVLFINKIINMKYYYDTKDLKNIVISKNEIFNLPYSLEFHGNKIEKKIFSKLKFKFLKLQIENKIDYKNDFIKGSANLILNKKKSNIDYELKENFLIFNFLNKINLEEYTYKGKVNFNPFYSSFQGRTKRINLTSLFGSNAIIAQLLKTEILNNKNIDFNFNVIGNKIKNYENFENIFLKSKIQEGLIDIDDTKFNWKNYANFEISDSLIYVSENQLLLEGKLIINISDPQKIYKFLLTPKNYRTDIKNIELGFNYNFDQKIMSLKDIKINNLINQDFNNILNNLNFKNDKLQNKIYLKNIINEMIKSYVG